MTNCRWFKPGKRFGFYTRNAAFRISCTIVHKCLLGISERTKTCSLSTFLDSILQIFHWVNFSSRRIKYELVTESLGNTPFCYRQWISWAWSVRRNHREKWGNGIILIPINTTKNRRRSSGIVSTGFFLYQWEKKHLTLSNASPFLSHFS